jgi:hypothetical protein
VKIVLSIAAIVSSPNALLAVREKWHAVMVVVTATVGGMVVAVDVGGESAMTVMSGVNAGDLYLQEIAYIGRCLF